jgi:peptidyl-dipeptidase A
MRRTSPLLFLLAACATPGTPSQEEASAFLDSAETVLATLAVPASQMAWVAATYITEDTEALSARFQTEFGAAVQQLATSAARFDDTPMPDELRRRFLLLKLSLAAPPPADPDRAAEMSALQVGMEADYGRGSWCPPGDGECLNLDALSEVIAKSRDADSLRMAWEGWRTVSPPMKDRYTRWAELANEGARGMGFADAGAMWRSGYDMDPDSFATEVERLWQQVAPLYQELHAYVRTRLRAKYGDLVPADGPIPAQFLGNMWSQEWGNIADLALPAGATPSYDLTALLSARGTTPLEMVRTGERFFLSLGFDSLPASFWARSQFTRPRDREVVCHASAWDIDAKNDIRIKMCIEPNADDFVTIHHELGHNFYQRAYAGQSPLYQNGANDGFHEAIGDAIALSITPAYLRETGLLGAVPSAAADTMLLLRQALDKIAFLPFGLLVDQWRWRVFDGTITPDQYNDSWWELRTRYQGIVPPGPRPAEAFDPGAKYHVPANTPYTRYFLARVLQFQFYRALCDAAGHEGPLYRCSFFDSKEAGERLNAMLELGASKPWPEALEQLTGSRTMDAEAMVEYFEPVLEWLKAQNAGQPVGW